MTDRRPKKKKSLIYLLLSLILIGVYTYSQGGDLSTFMTQVQNVTAHDTPSSTSSESFDISNRAKQHILYGDHRGGGHKFGANLPCKSEFPQNWDDTKIIDTVSRIAANDNNAWREEQNGYHVTEVMADNVKVRVVMNGDKNRVVTAYPTNVPRNPCPPTSYANDR